ncbi:hypothetical protein B296_00011101 [Ensete ventricosum]|uniref:Uncharacterized protein n=1 Tax=Ensete ventricosum TaxID=4639 RepID=A0A427B095_ENSVE|nr:hypothetical protein B296_00011101 [Ensete ventricosum]
MALCCGLQRRFCSLLGMTNREVKAAQEAVQKSDELDIRYCIFEQLDRADRPLQFRSPRLESITTSRNCISVLLTSEMCRRSPISIAAAVIYMITQLSDDKKQIKGFTVPFSLFDVNSFYSFVLTQMFSSSFVFVFGRHIPHNRCGRRHHKKRLQRSSSLCFEDHSHLLLQGGRPKQTLLPVTSPPIAYLLSPA